MMNIQSYIVNKSIKNLSKFNMIHAFILEFPSVQPFVIAIWCGPSKPSRVDEYLQQFVLELSYLMKNHLIINENKLIIRFGLIISDTPARSMVKGEIHSSVYGSIICLMMYAYAYYIDIYIYICFDYSQS